MGVRYGGSAARVEVWDGARASADAPEPEWEVRRFLFVVREAAAVYGGVDAALPHPAGARADALLELGDRIAELARSIQVAEAEMMRLIVEFDRERGWADAGFGSCAEWLALRIGIGANAARERVRTARALESLPLTTAAMEAGTLSYAKARSLTRVATPESEEALLALAQAGSAEHLERVVRAWKAMDDGQELAFEQMRHRNRRFSVFIDDDGSYVVKGRLEPEVGALLMRAVEAASDALYREERRAEGAEGGTCGADGCGAGATATDVGTADAHAADDCATRAGLVPGDTTPAQRRADAVGLLAERALAAGFGDDAVRGSRADRYQVMLHVIAAWWALSRTCCRSSFRS